jgi:hypothetical protein
VKNSNVEAVIGKIRAAEKAFKTSFVNIDKQWNDVARKEFEEKYVDTIEPNVKKLTDAIAQLATVLANAENQCG